MKTLLMIAICAFILTAIFTAGHEGNYSKED
ncbi:Tumor necrosis factor receptor superfamily member 19 OS=Ureibacillus acetophenoni OX=614649 GN=SAMN05877842_10728 PE=4 SV=1 [Ureibacillus acetophenoni]